jgi:hypothetical protein
MTEPTAYPEDDLRHHTAHLRAMLQGVVSHAREGIGKISEPKAQALFETTAEVCTGLIKRLAGRSVRPNAGIAPASAPAFITAQLVGGAIGTLLAVTLCPARPSPARAEEPAQLAS